MAMNESGYRIGQGIDYHRLVKGRKLILGGVTIPFEKGLKGHSDADVLSHAVCDALLGAAALGDIGQDYGQIKAIDINPMIIRDRTPVAVDALIVLAGE